MVTIAGSTKSSFLQKKILRNNFYVKKIKKKRKNNKHGRLSKSLDKTNNIKKNFQDRGTNQI